MDDEKHANPMPSAAAPRRRKVGRPRKAEGPAFPVNEVDRLLVHGEVVDGNVRYPSFRDLAQRFGVAHATIAQYAKRHDCTGRRQRAQAEVRDQVDRGVVDQTASAMIADKEQMDKLACEYLGAFAQALREGRVRADSFGDFNQAVRLVLFLRGEADARQEHLGELTLERLSERHRVWLESMARPPALLTGQVHQERPGTHQAADDETAQGQKQC